MFEETNPEVQRDVESLKNDYEKRLSHLEYDILSLRKRLREKAGWTQLKEVVNGIEIVCSYVDDYDRYELYFPQIERGEHQTIGLSWDPDTAKKAFDFAKSSANTVGKEDAFALYKKVGGEVPELVRKV